MPGTAPSRLEIVEVVVFSLVRLSGSKQGERIVLDGELVRLGRARGNEVKFDRDKDRVVSNSHAEIRLEDGQHVLYDLQSTHGTFVNDQRVTRWKLREGDIVGLAPALGGPTLRYSRRVEEGARPIDAVQANNAGDMESADLDGTYDAPRTVPKQQRAQPAEARPGEMPEGSVDRADRIDPRAGRRPDERGEAPMTAEVPRAMRASMAAAGRGGGEAQGPDSTLPLSPRRRPAASAGAENVPTSAWARGPVVEPTLPIGGASQVVEPTAAPMTGASSSGVAGASGSSGGPAPSWLEDSRFPSVPGVDPLADVEVTPESPLRRFAGKSGRPAATESASAMEDRARADGRAAPVQRGAGPGASATGRGAPRPAEPRRQAPVHQTVEASRTETVPDTPVRQPGGAFAGLGRLLRRILPAKEAGDDEIRRRSPVQEYRRKAAAKEVLSRRGAREPVNEPEVELHPDYPRPFILEEAIKEKPRPEWEWISSHKIQILLVASIVAVVWAGFDELMTRLMRARVEPAVVVVGRAVDAAPITPPGAKNPELVRQTSELFRRVRALPPQQLVSGDATLRTLRPIVREAGEDSEFIPVDFSKQVDAEVKRIKVQRDLSFIYGRSRRFRPELVRSLEAAGLPAFMSYIPWLESSFSPEFTDRREGRVGLWGLTADTARRHGLVVVAGRDDRRDWRLETTAACSYLMELVGESGAQSFGLAASVFREGPTAARSMLAQQNAWRPEELSLWSFMRQQYLPSRQNEYLVRLMAVAVVIQSPERFGLPPADREIPE